MHVHVSPQRRSRPAATGAIAPPPPAPFRAGPSRMSFEPLHDPRCWSDEREPDADVPQRRMLLAGHVEPLEITPAPRHVLSRVIATPDEPPATLRFVDDDPPEAHVCLPVLQVDDSGHLAPAGNADGMFVLRYVAAASILPVAESCFVLHTTGVVGPVHLPIAA